MDKTVLDERLTRHEEKCDARMARIYDKFDVMSARIHSVEKTVWLGVGIFTAINIFLMTVGRALINSFMG